VSAQGILIAGGYGVVGRRIAAELAPDYADQVIVAGRNLDRAKTTATAIGYGARGREVDVNVPSSIAAALNDVAVDAAARVSGARVVLGTGIVPGIANVMVRAVAETLGGAEEIETSLLLSASDAAGPASFDYFLRELSMPFVVHVDGADCPARAFSDPRLIEFPPPVGARPAYLFPFSDQVLYPRTMGARTALTRLAIEPAILAKLLTVVVRTRVASLIAREPVRQAVSKQRKDRAPSADTLFALRVDVTNHGQSSDATLLGPAQAAAAAAGAAGVVRCLLDGEVVEPGAWMPEQVIDPGPFFSRLATRGLNVELAPVVLRSA